MSISDLKFVLPALLTLGLASAQASCDTEAGDKPLGAVCATSGECQSGICGGNKCLDPAGDEDGDGLINEVEHRLGSNPAAVDSDGDGTDDFTEVGDIQAPPDSDGDGKIDAIESDQRDKDNDCLVDERDPFDTVSAPPSAAFPEACGGSHSSSYDDYGYDDYGDYPESDYGYCAPGLLAGTCAAPLGEMLFDCFSPTGSCAVELPQSSNAPAMTTWESGATIEWASIEGQASGLLFSATGQRCGGLQELAPVEALVSGADVIFEVADGGARFTVRPLDDGLEIRCSEAETVTLSPSATAQFTSCSGLDSLQSCAIADGCLSDADCDGGLCCPAGGASVCMAVDACPNTSN